MRLRTKRAYGLGLLLVLAPAIGWVAGASLRGPATDVTLAPTLESGTQWVAMVMVSSSCRFCRDERFAPAIRTILEDLSTRAADHGATLRSVGVGTDSNVALAGEFLAEVAEFDQVILGGGWLNEALTEYVWTKGWARPGTPQLLLFERRVEVSEDRIEVGEPRLIANPDGLDALLAWGEGRVTLDGL